MSGHVIENATSTVGGAKSHKSSKVGANFRHCIKSAQDKHTPFNSDRPVKCYFASFSPQARKKVCRSGVCVCLPLAVQSSLDEGRIHAANRRIGLRYVSPYAHPMLCAR